MIEQDYLGRRVLTSYAPLVPEESWAVIVQVEEDDAKGDVMSRPSRADGERYIYSGQVWLRLPLLSGNVPILTLHDGDYLGMASARGRHT